MYRHLVPRVAALLCCDAAFWSIVVILLGTAGPELFRLFNDLVCRWLTSTDAG